jgi:alkyldihydroxyacetonephosphate synthase
MAPAIDPIQLREQLEAIVGERRVSVAISDLDTYARDTWPRLLLSVQAGVPLEHRPHAVVWPESAREVSQVVRLASARGLALVPYGGGSGVCGGAVPVAGGITIDLKRMNSVLSLDSEQMICDVEAGMNGERFERELNRRGYTLGHFPSSIYCSTVGGWVATRAAGQMSSKYGKIEDRITGITAVTGRGELVRTDGPPRATRGPNWSQLLCGSEGTLGVITSVRLRVRPAPELRVFRCFDFRGLEAGLEAIRRVMQRGLRPAVLRLYDELDTLLHAGPAERAGAAARSTALAPAPVAGSGALPQLPGATPSVRPGPIDRLLSVLGGSGTGIRDNLRRETVAALLGHPRLLNGLALPAVERLGRRCRLIVGLEGARIRTGIESRLAFAELERAGGIDQGEEPGRAWFEHRYAVSYGMSRVFREGAFVDTMEVAATWDRLLDLYHAVRQVLTRHAFVMAHFSHAYPEGCSIYFTFLAVARTLGQAQRTYDQLWREGLAAASRVGGTISHHHGVGLLKGAAMNAEHREAMGILRALKQTFDPQGLFNPGKLGLPLGGPAGGRAREGGRAWEGGTGR